MTTRYLPPTKVKTLQIPFKVMVLRADPGFEAGKRKEPFYEFSNGRVFNENTTLQGAYASDLGVDRRMTSNGGFRMIVGGGGRVVTE